ncbi:MAG: hypothetical protein RL227_2683 [Pseudomonadota bacterium]
MTSDRRPEHGLEHAALLVVDVQRDFLPGGSLPVPAGDRVLGPLRACAARCRAAGVPVLASRDWHPPAHCSLHAQGGPWPPHCVAGSPGAEFPPALALLQAGPLLCKGCMPGRDAYSAFDGTGLQRLLQALQVRRLVVGGLATDYCVLATVLDARARGYEVLVLRDAVAAVDVQPGDGACALARMEAAGAQLVDSATLLH